MSAALKKLFRQFGDQITIAVGSILFVLAVSLPDSKLIWALIAVAGILGLVYMIRGLVICCNSVKLDWHLIHGHFLRKVSCVVILMPFVITTIFSIFVLSKDLVFDPQLYEIGDRSLSYDILFSQESPNLFWTVYYHFIDAGNQHMTASLPGRVLAAIIAMLGVFLLNGLLVSSIIGEVDKRKERWLKGEAKYHRVLKRKSHYVIIGGNDMVPGIVSELLEVMQNTPGTDTTEYILIQTSRDVESFRRELFSTLTIDQQQKIIIYYGNRNSEADIRVLCLETAKEVYVLGEESRTDDLESYHDTMNMECLKLIGKEIETVDKFSKGNELVCRVMFEYQTSFNVFQVTDVDGNKIKFLPFNYYEKWAQKVLICQELVDKNNCKYYPLEGFEGIKSADDSYVHLVIVGMSRMGVAMAIESAHLAHYPNYEEKGIRTKITFIDSNAAEEMEFFMGRFKDLFSLSHWRYGNVDDGCLVWEKDHEVSACSHLGGDFIDVEWEFINGSVENAAVHQYLLEASSDEKAKLTVAVCLPENSRAIAAAAYMPDELYRSRNTLQVLVYQRLSDELVRQINANNGRYCQKMKAFGMAKCCYDSKLVELAESIEPSITGAYNLYGDCIKWVREHSPESESMSLEQVMEIVAEEKKMKPVDNEKKKVSTKSNSAKMWSNHYNIYSMWTKYRSITTEDGHIFNPLVDDFDGLESKMMKELGMMEHNRWVVEQLLLRYRPLSKSEQEDAMVPSLNSSSERKDFYKRTMNAHLDICSNGRLDEVDYRVSMLDRTLISVLPGAYRKFFR